MFFTLLCASTVPFPEVFGLLGSSILLAKEGPPFQSGLGLLIRGNGAYACIRRDLSSSESCFRSRRLSYTVV